MIVKDPNSKYFFDRKRDSTSTIGLIVALIQVKNLIPIIIEYRSSQIGQIQPLQFFPENN